MSTFRSLPVIHQQPEPPLVLAAGGRRPLPQPLSPLDIPEILEHILSYLDTRTICSTLARVCRAWYLLHRHRIVREVVWDSDLTLDKLKTIPVQQVQRATRLHCYFRHYGLHYSDRMGWLVNCLQTGAEKARQDYAKNAAAESGGGRVGLTSNTHENADPEPLFAAQPLCDLVLQGLINVSIALPVLLPHVSSITTLSVQQQGSSMFTMARIFAYCPQLETLHLEAAGIITLTGPWLPDPTSANNESTTNKRSSSPSLPLQSLALINTRLSQSCLETLLSVSPDMQSLKVVAHRNSNNPPSEYDFTCLCAHLRSLHMTLKTFHFSVIGGGEETFLTPEGVAAIRELCPRATGWTLQGQELGSTFYRMLSEQWDKISALEIMHHTRYLHSLLCLLPHLLELKAIHGGYYYHHLDVFRSTTTVLSLETGALEDEPPRIWACSRLRTLHMAIYDFNENPVITRSIFGYISRVCPQLQDLWIREAIFLQDLSFLERQSGPCLTLDGGLCLLTKLKDLRSLRIGHEDLQVRVKNWDIDWMVPLDKRSWWQHTLSKRKRQLWFTTSKNILEQDADVIVERVREINERNEVALGTHGTTKETMYLLRHCGLLQDVKQTVNELDKKGSQVWPELRRISFCQKYGSGQSVEKETARLLLNR